MHVSTDFNNDQLTLHIRGPFTIYEAGTAKSVLLDELATADDMEVDLSGVSEFDTAGLQLLLMMKREALRTDKPLRFRGHSKAVLTVIDLYNLGGAFGDPVVLAGKGRA